jgi:hypothetical protein
LDAINPRSPNFVYVADEMEGRMLRDANGRMPFEDGVDYTGCQAGYAGRTAEAYAVVREKHVVGEDSNGREHHLSVSEARLATKIKDRD